LKTPDQELVGNALRQRRLRTDNGEVNLLFLGYFNQPLYISRVYIQVLSNLSCAGIARSDVNLFYFRALG
jgi:hypothetical protein